MNYIMKAGVLYREGTNEVLAKISKTFTGQERIVSTPDSTRKMKTEINDLLTSDRALGDVRRKEYALIDDDGETAVFALPEYTAKENPDEKGWPLYRMPKVDHASVSVGEKTYSLVMLDNRHYSLLNKDRSSALEIVHRGISGGWQISTYEVFEPLMICGIYIFCRYMEQENVFPLV